MMEVDTTETHGCVNILQTIKMINKVIRIWILYDNKFIYTVLDVEFAW